MGLPRITYSFGSPLITKNVDFAIGPSTLDPIQPLPGNLKQTNYDHTIRHTIVLPQQGLMRFEWPVVVDANKVRDAATERGIEQWQIWADRGTDYPWTFARDRDKTGLTTISAAVSRGATTLQLTDTTAFVAGDDCVIRTPTSIDIVRIASVTGSPPVVTLTEALNYSFGSGAIFRHKLYWNALLVRSELRDLMPNQPYYSFSLEFEEVLE
jgi:hypothetical protein